MKIPCEIWRRLPMKPFKLLGTAPRGAVELGARLTVQRSCLPALWPIGLREQGRRRPSS